MISFETWLATHGPDLAQALDARRDIICETVANRLTAVYPALCYDPKRVDADSFQQLTFDKTPVRFHKLLVAVLRFHSLNVFERECAWSWKILPRYGVGPAHMVSMIQWYMDAARAQVAGSRLHSTHMATLEAALVAIVERTAPAPQAAPLPVISGPLLRRIGPHGVMHR